MVAIKALIWVLVLVTSSLPYESQPERGNQILFRDLNRLYLADAKTGEVIKLPDLTAGLRDWWFWSPNGRYLLGYLAIGGNRDVGCSIRVYDVEKLTWLDRVSLHVPCYQGDTVAWLSDSQQFSFSTYEGGYGQLRVFDLISRRQRTIHTILDEGEGLWYTSIGSQWWSPTSDYVVFVEKYWGHGGPVDVLTLFDIRNGHTTPLYSDQEAAYQVAWSPDGKSILTVANRNVSPGNYDCTNRDRFRGYWDVFLYSVENQQQFLLTTSPYQPAWNPQWIDEGESFQFRMPKRSVNFSPTSFMDDLSLIEVNVEAVYVDCSRTHREISSPDGEAIAILESRERSFDLYLASHRELEPRFIAKLSWNFTPLLLWRPQQE